MKRRTLDVAFSAGGLLIAAALLVLGLVLSSQASFADDYVRDQLLEQQISFPDEYSRGETDVAGSDCLNEYIGSALDSGDKAECYANFYIKTPMMHSADDAGYADATYATLGGIVRGLSADLEAAQAGTDQAAIDAAQAKVDAASGLRETMFKGETLRGLLLTTYGFSIFGDRAAMAALVCYLAAALMLVLSIAGFVHAAAAKKAGAAIA